MTGQHEIDQREGGQHLGNRLHQGAGQRRRRRGARLRRDRLLTPEELFSVAFPLAEGRPEDLPAAEEILEHLKARHGRTKAGRAARNKLSLLASRQPA